jgi:hypothetical protein
MVGSSTRFPIVTGGFVETNVLASGLPRAQVIGAWIVIVAQIYVVPCDFCRFVQITVAVVVHAVALLQGRNRCITVCEAINRANPLAVASAEFVGRFAWSPERQLHGFSGARALPGVCNALRCVDAIDCDCC